MRFFNVFKWLQPEYSMSIPSGQDTRFFPERLTGKVRKIGFTGKAESAKNGLAKVKFRIKFVKIRASFFYPAFAISAKRWLMVAASNRTDCINYSSHLVNRWRILKGF